MSWVFVTETVVPRLPFALVDRRGRVYALTEDIQCAAAWREILTRALGRVVSGADTCPTLIHSGLTHADGSLTQAGFEWAAHVDLPTEQTPN